MAVLYKSLKTQYEQSGTLAEFYTRQNYDNTKLSKYESVCNFLTRLMNLAHLVNKEMRSSARQIEDRTIAMHTIHSLPPSMCTLQTILIENTPDSSDMNWDLDTLKKQIEANECCAWAAGESLRTKSDSPQNQSHPRRQDPNDPTWLAQQTCWNCGKTGHL